MDCHSNHSVFLRANGSLACWDDAGSKLTLKNFDPMVDYSRDVVFGPVFGHIRSSLKKGAMPFPEVCQDCMIFASGACFNPSWAEKKEILIFQVEASIACILECPGCMTFVERKARHGKPWHLDPAVFEKYLSDFKADGVTIRTIDFQGHGEPLLNKAVWTMAGMAKAYFPQANISMCTASLGTYDPSQVNSGIDEMMFAIDGIDQQSYEPNRIRGSFDKAFRYMKDFCHGAAAEGRQIKTVWKYILFDCNSRPDQLVRAQELAAEAGVQELLFVNTQLGLKSSRILTRDQIPLLDGGVKVSISNYLSNFHDMIHAVDKARYALFLKDDAAAKANLLFAANMMRRRFEQIGREDVLPHEYQAVLYELLDLCQHSRVTPETRALINAGVHAVHGKLVIGQRAAKDQIIAWKSEEVARLSGQVARTGGISATRLARSLAERGFRLVEPLLKKDVLSIQNRIIRWKSEEVVRLATLIGQQAAPETPLEQAGA